MRNMEAEHPHLTQRSGAGQLAAAARAGDLDEIRAGLHHERTAREAQLDALLQEMEEAIAAGDDARRHIVDVLIRTTEGALSEYDGALDRMRTGSYGTCERCAATIPTDRLEVRPTSRFCVPCQREAEAG